jgi:hypothetical protein
MAEQDVETTLANGEVEQPTQPPSETAVQSSDINIKALAEALKPIIADEVERRTQSTKDKRISKLQGAVDGFESKLAKLDELMQSGLSKNEALWRMKVEDRLEQGLPAEQTTEPVGKQARETSESDVIEAVLKASGLEANSPEVTEILRSTDDPMEQIGKFAALAARRKQKPVSTATVMQTTAGAGSITPSREQLTAELQRLHNAPRKDWAKIHQTNKALEELIRK